MVETSDAVVRAHLQDERDRLREQLTQMDRGTDGDLSFDGGFADTSQVTAERGEIDALASTLTERLGEIEDALVKLEAGSYGRCESCGGQIAPARLEAMPGARLCIDCASRRR
jgi:RNA polymerase-binding transcription factor DksA